jgi:DNA-binding MarR family transcriptional regulator
MISLYLKPVNNRRYRPSWATNEKQLMLHCVGNRPMIRFEIAQMYWLRNMSAKEIAAKMKMTKHNVEMILHRLAKT